ncbi:MAG: hypothetical protein IJW77_04830 [Clostridia bacterium]|nr:hypothetical protein [Clostridia bacterium]
MAFLKESFESFNMIYETILYGDGIHDDTDAIRERLKCGGHVILSKGVYLISDTLYIPENTYFQLQMGAVVRLADGACCCMLKNEVGYGRNITIEGGIWDGNNSTQKRGKVYPDKPFFMGIVMRFEEVTDLCIKNLTVKDPESYAIQIRNVDRFTVENITFDFNMLRPNMDGVHIQGKARNGVVRNIKGATNDDMIALNCDDGYDDGEKGIIAQGDIENIIIDGIFADNGYTGVRMLSCGSKMRNVAIRNVFGTYRFYGISFTHHDIIPGAPVWFDGIVLENIFASKPPQDPPVDRKFIDGIDRVYGEGCHDGAVRYAPIIWFASGIRCGNIIIRNLNRIEEAITDARTIQIDENVHIKQLYLSGISQKFISCLPPSLIDNRGKIDVFIKDIQESEEL